MYIFRIRYFRTPFGKFEDDSQLKRDVVQIERKVTKFQASVRNIEAGYSFKLLAYVKTIFDTR